jgi:hypothetical protein
MKTYKSREGESTEDRLNRLEDEFQECRDNVFQSLATIQTQLNTLIGLAEAWNNWRGFARIMALLSAAIRTLTPIALLAMAVAYFIKTGVWTWVGGDDK